MCKLNHRGLLGPHEKKRSFIMVRCRKRMQKFQFNGKICFRRSVVLPLLIMCFVTPMLMIHLSPSLPRNFSLGPAPEPTCELPGKPFALDDFEFCVGACRSQCFPRVKDLCISSSEVNYCAKAKEEEEIASAQLMHTNTDEKKLIKFKYSRMPEIMRFQGERLTLPVINSSCDQEKKGIRGLSLVADQRFLPYKKPNPHHEAEKLIPAILFTRNQKDSNHTFYWFSAPDEVSEWGKGLLEAFNMHKRVKYIDFPKRKNSTICFEDAIVYSAGTNLYYVPDHDTNDWLRQRVLRFCNVPIVNASWPPRKAVILDRRNGSRQLQNKHMVAKILYLTLGVHARQDYSGIGSFCDQVRKVAEEDLIVVPHGSQNVNLLFARKGAVVIEIFPYLYYTTALKNYTHAAQLHLYPLLGDIPENSLFMRLVSIVGWDFCFERLQWCKNYSRKQFIHADIRELQKLLHQIRRDNLVWNDGHYM